MYGETRMIEKEYTHIGTVINLLNDIRNSEWNFVYLSINKTEFSTYNVKYILIDN